ncbi:MAG: nucleoside hydrolase [Ruminococcaceae bacterium]|nr:nucleoside hydrolase [Oscillospiraceae bacterium]
MTNEQFLKNLTPPEGKVDIIIDSDAFTEIDDLYAISYAVLKTEKFNIKGICAAPFCKPPRSVSPEDGMLKSYDEILRLLKLLNREDLNSIVFKGSAVYLENEITPVESDAADFISNTANEYSPENPLYIVAIGAVSNIASAILKNPKVKENTVAIWLGGNATHLPMGANEYNMRNDLTASRVLMSSGIPLVQLPCMGTVDKLLTTKPELEYWLKGKNRICNYLYERTVADGEKYSPYKTWSRVIWDISTCFWLMNGDKKYMQDKLVPAPIPEYTKEYSFNENRHKICQVYSVNRDAIFNDLFETLTKF